MLTGIFRVGLIALGVVFTFGMFNLAQAQDGFSAGSTADLPPIDLLTPLKTQADELLQIQKERGPTIDLIEGLADLSRTCIMVLGAELLATERDKEGERRPGESPLEADLFGQGYDAFSSRSRSKARVGIANELDSFVGANIRLRTFGLQLTESLPQEQQTFLIQGIQADLRFQLKAFRDPLIQMRAGGGEEARLYTDALKSCQGFVKARGTRYESLFEGLLF